MREISLVVGNYLLFLLAIYLLLAFQSSIWFQLFGHFPSPVMWLPIMAYWTLNRNIYEGIAMVYLVTFVMASMSTIPLGLCLAVNMTLFGMAYFIKRRIYWPGVTYYMLVCGIGASLFPVLHLVYSLIFEMKSLNEFSFFHWIVGSFMTSVVALPLFAAFSLLDRLSKKDISAETGTHEI